MLIGDCMTKVSWNHLTQRSHLNYSGPHYFLASSSLTQVQCTGCPNVNPLRYVIQLQLKPRQQKNTQKHLFKCLALLKTQTYPQNFKLHLSLYLMITISVYTGVTTLALKVYVTYKSAKTQYRNLSATN